MFHPLRKDCAGVVAMEYGIVALFMFALVFGTIDVGRYAVTLHQMSILADEAARQQIICYAPYTAKVVTSVTCAKNPLSTDTINALAPFASTGGVLSITTAPQIGPGPRTVTVSLSGFNTFFLPRTLLPIDDPLVVTTALPF